ncbi:phosphoenolpyruvate--protein phosphotransferase [Paenibacillus validus]|uniref:Phosphoenolpyruvate-protein phosphotransferase n=1 Tax=Paenibacillus validus TaxID=44253 RepID=A0A7X2Z7B5_9BACL|nr:phosphoenolpyruvate--protein phosphotransferase [Paenibacillus validus]MUG69673.1 phosphoenolpyruvate--protein phosphotransferase [Paenibacillus validus]
MSHVLTGIAASPGFAIAKAVPLQAEKYVPQRRSIDDVPAETERFRKAVAEAKRELEAIRQSTEERLGPDKAEIFEGHLLLLEDPELIDAAAEQIAEQAVDAEYALYEVSQSFIEALLSLDNELLRGRAVDLQDVAGRVINHLRGVSHTTVSSLLEACIIVAEDLTPSDTAQLNLEIVRGFVTEIGSRTSHSAIMARSLDVPAIVGAGAGVHAIQAGDTVVLDALEGRIVVNPSDAELADYREKQAQYERRKAELARLKDRPTESADGHRVELAANIGSVEDVAKALENGAEAIGLFRTEFLYMGRTSLPTEEEQYNSYKHVLEKMEGKPVVIRTLDIGGDKELPYMSLPKESNPFLGLRALRLCLSREDLFRTQLRALLRASRHGQLKIMFPMISVLDELLEAKRLLQEEKEKLLREGAVVAERIEVGMMIEVPAAAIGADIFASEVDFFSIGTNDLIQYMMAADRMNETVSYLYQPCHPTVLRLVQTVIRAARREGKWVGMCGEMAGDETAIPLLLGLGLHEFSMSASSILPSRALIGTLSQREWEGLAEQALTLRSQQEVKQLVRERLSRPKEHSAATL